MPRLLRATALATAVVLACASTAAASPDGGVTATVVVSAVGVRVNLSASTATVGESVRAEATVTNLGHQAIGSVAVELRGDGAGLGIRGGSSRTIMHLRPGAAGTVWWQICGRSAGSYIVLVSATAGQVSIDSPARLLTISDDGRRRSSC